MTHTKHTHLPSTLDAFPWSYHVVVIVEGLVHDAWLPIESYPVQEYLSVMFLNRPEDIVLEEIRD